jgi:hypothetical protein
MKVILKLKNKNFLSEYYLLLIKYYDLFLFYFINYLSI